jgi:hypothetical protein
MLSFVDALKQIIANIQATGGMTIERTLPSPQLLQELREYAVQRLAEATSIYQLEEWFTEGYFDEHVRVCVVHLHKLGISQDDRAYHLISKVIDAIVRDSFGIQDKKNFETQLVGILFTDSDENTFNPIHVTPIGQAVLRAVLSQDNPFRDTALAIIQTEEVGGTFNESASEINEILHLVNQTNLIGQANRESIETGVQLYRTRRYLDSLRVIYPSIEAIINTMLIEAGEVPERFRGLVDKAQRLEQQGIIPYDVAHAMEVFTGRNTVVHGNFSPPEDYVFPLCLLAFRYLRRLLTEYHPMS